MQRTDRTPSLPSTPTTSPNRITVIPDESLSVTAAGASETHPWTDELAIDVLSAVIDMATAREVLLAAHGVTDIDQIPREQRPEPVTISIQDGHLPEALEVHLTRLLRRAHHLGLIIERLGRSGAGERAAHAPDGLEA